MRRGTAAEGLGGEGRRVSKEDRLLHPNQRAASGSEHERLAWRPQSNGRGWGQEKAKGGWWFAGGWGGGVVDLTRLTVGCWTACDLVLFWLF